MSRLSAKVGLLEGVVGTGIEENGRNCLEVEGYLVDTGCDRERGGKRV